MGFLQVDGLCEQLPGGSRRNVAEAETIAAWIADRKASLEQSYPEQRLSDIPGIVTPFAAQVRTIQAALNSVGIDTEQGTGVTIGSVHAFQGGQRPVMIFSPTYSKHADGNFIDMGTSMLNVAVSRAMNSFLVFGVSVRRAGRLMRQRGWRRAVASSRGGARRCAAPDDRRCGRARRRGNAAD
jgi:superfamily I DNA and/or RNA helicase